MMMGFEILVIGIIVLVLVQVLSRSSWWAGLRQEATSSAKETLDARLARGEISLEEYRKIVETLEGRETPSSKAS